MHVDMHGNMRYMVCKLPKLAIEIKSFYETSRGISTMKCPQDMAFSQDMTFPQDVSLDLHTWEILLFTLACISVIISCFV